MREVHERVQIYSLYVNHCGDDPFDRFLEFWFCARDVPNHNFPITTTGDLEKVRGIREILPKPR